MNEVILDVERWLAKDMDIKIWRDTCKTGLVFWLLYDVGNTNSFDHWPGNWPLAISICNAHWHTWMITCAWLCLFLFCVSPWNPSPVKGIKTPPAAWFCQHPPNAPSGWVTMTIVILVHEWKFLEGMIARGSWVIIPLGSCHGMTSLLSSLISFPLCLCPTPSPSPSDSIWPHPPAFHHLCSNSKVYSQVLHTTSFFLFLCLWGMIAQGSWVLCMTSFFLFLCSWGMIARGSWVLMPSGSVHDLIMFLSLCGEWLQGGLGSLDPWVLHMTPLCFPLSLWGMIAKGSWVLRPLGSVHDLIMFLSLSLLGNDCKGVLGP